MIRWDHTYIRVNPYADRAKARRTYGVASSCSARPTLREDSDRIVLVQPARRACGRSSSSWRSASTVQKADDERSVPLGTFSSGSSHARGNMSVKLRLGSKQDWRKLAAYARAPNFRLCCRRVCPSVRAVGSHRRNRLRTCPCVEEDRREPGRMQCAARSARIASPVDKVRGRGRTKTVKKSATDGPDCLSRFCQYEWATISGVRYTLPSWRIPPPPAASASSVVRACTIRVRILDIAGSAGSARSAVRSPAGNTCRTMRQRTQCARGQPSFISEKDRLSSRLRTTSEGRIRTSESDSSLGSDPRAPSPLSPSTCVVRPAARAHNGADAVCTACATLSSSSSTVA